MRKLNLNCFVSMAIICVWSVGCSKKTNDAANTPANGSAGTAAVAKAEGVQTEPAGPVEMKLKWQVGKEYDQEMSMLQTAHMEIPGAPQPIDQHMTLTQDFSISAIKELPGGGTELDLKFTGLKLNSKAGDQMMMDFDSSRNPKDDGNDPSAAVFRRMIGAHIKYQVDASGQVIKVEGMDEFLANMSHDNPQAISTIRALMNEETMKQLVMRGQGLPPKPVSVGDQWPVNLDVKAGQAGMMQMNMNYTFKGWQQHEGHKCALMTFTGSMSTKPHASTGPVDVSVDKGVLDGKMWFDPELNMVMQTDSEQNVPMKLTMQGKTMNSQMEQNISVKVVKITNIPL